MAEDSKEKLREIMLSLSLSSKEKEQVLQCIEEFSKKEADEALERLRSQIAEARAILAEWRAGWQKC